MTGHNSGRILIGKNVPKIYRERTLLTPIDYIDAISIPTNISASPEAWARAMFGDTPDLGERFIWQVLLGLKINPTKSSDRIAGWQIIETTKDWIKLEARSRIVTVNLVVSTDQGGTSLATFVRYNNQIGKLIWTPLSAAHRRLSPTLINDAKQKLSI